MSETLTHVVLVIVSLLIIASVPICLYLISYDIMKTYHVLKKDLKEYKNGQE